MKSSIADLWVPRGLDTIDQSVIAQQMFGPDPRSSGVYVAASSLSEMNILSKPQLLNFMSIYEDLVAHQVQMEGRWWAYGDVCSQLTPTFCDHDSILNFWNYDRAALEADLDVVTTVNG